MYKGKKRVKEVMQFEILKEFFVILINNVIFFIFFLLRLYLVPEK